MAEYLAYIDAHPAAVNVTPLLARGPCGSARWAFPTPNYRAADREHEGEVTKAMQAGCAGFPPGLYTCREIYHFQELVALCSALCLRRLYVTHIATNRRGL
jgi:hypothetical protein